METTSWDGIVIMQERHSFLYNIDSKIYTPLDFPGSDYTYVYDIDGNNIVGSCSTSGEGTVFLYDITTSTYTIVQDAPPNAE